MIILWAPTFYDTNGDPKCHKVKAFIRQGAAPAAFCTESCDRGGSCEVGVGVARPGPANPPCLLSCACGRGCGRCLAKLPGASEIMARTSMQMQRNSTVVVVVTGEGAPRLWEKGVGVSRGLMPATTWVAERIESTFRSSRPPSVQTPSTVLLAFGATWEAQNSGQAGTGCNKARGAPPRSEPQGGEERRTREVLPAERAHSQGQPSDCLLKKRTL